MKNNEAQAFREDKRINRATLGYFIESVKQFRIYAIMALVGFAISTISFSALLPYLFSQAIDRLATARLEHVYDGLTSLLYGALAVAAAGTLGLIVAFKGFSKLDNKAQSYLRDKVLSRLLHESAAFYATTMTGSLTGNIITFTNAYMTVQDVIVQRAMSIVLPIIVSIGIVAFQSPALALLFVLITIVIAVKTLRDSRKRSPYRRARKMATTKMNGFIGDVISNSTTIRTFAGEKREMQGLLARQATWMKASETNLWLFGQHSTQLIGTISILQVAGIAIAVWMSLHGHISIGLVVFAAIYFQRLGGSLLELAPAVQQLQGALMDAAPITEILISRPQLVDYSGAKRLKVSSGSIALRDVTYCYEDSTEPVFDKLSLTIKGGQSIGLVGRSGSGKTTLTNLVLRFADIQSGEIAIDDQDISRVTQRSLRDAISYVPQDSHLFHRTIFDNIAYGSHKPTEKQVIEAAKKAHIWDYIKSLPEGLATVVGERGVKLSGGQRQRVAIARAILKDAPIMVFDEATSALDSESEQYIQESLDGLMKNRTSIVVAHRLSTIQKMDRIIVMDQGQIIEDGSHRELVAKKGVYASLWKRQSGGFIEE